VYSFIVNQLCAISLDKVVRTLEIPSEHDRRWYI